MRRIAAALLLCWILFPDVLRAQNPAVLSLEAAATSVQTGQMVEVNIRLEGASEVWLADMQIAYDPAKVYVMGTKAGSPVRQGSLFSPGASAVVRNVVQSDLVLYNISMLAPAEPISGGGVIGTIRIYPLAPGETQITFRQGELVRVLFETRDGQRVGAGSEPIAFTPVLLGLSIIGEQVELPSEATATPVPTDTPVPPPAGDIPTEVPTLVNVTAGPRTPEALATVEVPASDSNPTSPLPWIALAIMLFTVTVLAILVVRMLRERHVDSDH